MLIWEKMPDVIAATPAVQATVAVLAVLGIAAVAAVLLLNRREKLLAAEQLRHIREDIERQYAYYAACKKEREEAAMWRHDYNNHLRTLQALLAAGKTEQALQYARQLCGQPDKI
jgi:hypothetical protein